MRLFPRLGAVLILSAPAAFGQFGIGLATEFTQTLNHLQLMAQYLRQADQLAEAVKQTADMLKNSKTINWWTFDSVDTEMRALQSIVQYGHGVAYSMAGADVVFRNTYPGYVYHPTVYYRDYEAWNRASLDAMIGALRAAGFHSDMLTTATGVINMLRTSLTGSDGRMKALEVLGQIADMQAGQLMSLRQILLADLQSKQAYQADQLQKEAQGVAMEENFFRYSPDAPDSTTFKGGWE